MNRDILTNIDIIFSQSETACIISISHEIASSVAIMISAFRLELIECIVFRDGEDKVEIQHHTNMNCKKRPHTCTLSIADNLIDISYEWLDLVSKMLLDVVLNGWSDVAHVDQDFVSSGVDISISINVIYP